MFLKNNKITLWEVKPGSFSILIGVQDLDKKKTRKEKEVLIWALFERISLIEHVDLDTKIEIHKSSAQL